MSTGHRACRCLWGRGQVKKIWLETFPEGGNWRGWTDWFWQVVPKRRGTRADTVRKFLFQLYEYASEMYSKCEYPALRINKFSSHFHCIFVDRKLIGKHLSAAGYVINWFPLCVLLLISHSDFLATIFTQHGYEAMLFCIYLCRLTQIALAAVKLCIGPWFF